MGANEGSLQIIEKYKLRGSITRYIILSGRQDILKTLSENVTPVNLESPDPIDFNNKFPYSEAELSFFHVAKQRRVDLNNLAFCFGGSALHMLAYKESSDFIVSRVTGTRCSLVANRRTYNKDNGLFGFHY